MSVTDINSNSAAAICRRKFRNRGCGDHVGEALDALTAEFTELRNHLFNEQNNLRNFINVYVGDEDIRHLDGPETPVKDGETLMIVPSIAGGNFAAEARAYDRTARADEGRICNAIRGI